jgi:hypothetical protein
MPGKDVKPRRVEIVYHASKRGHRGYSLYSPIIAMEKQKEGFAIKAVEVTWWTDNSVTSRDL